MAKTWAQMSYLERVMAEARGLAGLGKQAAAGAAEGTIANSSEGSGYRPALVDAVPSVVGVVTGLVKSGQPFDGSNVAEQWVINSMRRQALATQRTNDTLGIKNPANTGELGARILGSLLVPSVKGASVARAVSKTGKAGTKVVEGTRKVVANTPKPLRKVAKVATEIAVPLRQTKVLPAAVVGGVLTAGMDAALDGAVDPTTGEVYDGSVRGALGFKEPTQADALENLITQDLASEVEEPPMTQADQLEQSLAAPLDDETLDAAEEEDKVFTWENAALTVGAVFAGGALAKYGRAAVKDRIRASEELPEFIGKTVRKSRAGFGEKLITAAVETTQPIRSVINDHLGPAVAKRWGYMSDLTNNVAIGSKVAHQFRTGRMAGTDQRTVRLAPLAQAFAKELPLEKQKQVGDALLAASALDDFNRAGVLSALNKNADGVDMTPQDLQRLVRETRADPQLAKYMDAVQTSFRDILKFRVARGTMSQEVADDFMRLRPNYVKMKRDLDVDAKAMQDSGSFNPNSGVKGNARNVEENTGVQGGAVGNPFNVLFDDWASEIRRAEIDKVRGSFLQQMTAIPQNGIVRRIPNGQTPKTEAGVVNVWENGQEASYIVSDPLVARALEMSPRASIQALEQVRQIAQNVVTGPIGTLFNGFSAFVSPMYDTGLGMLNRPKGMKVSLPGLGLADAYVGAVRYMWDDLRGSMATNLADQMIRANAPLKTLLGEQRTQALADRFAQAYEGTVKAFMDEQGVSSMTMHGSPDPTQVLSGLDSVAPTFADDAARIAAQNEGVGLIEKAKGNNAYLALKGNAVSRTYGSVLEAMHNGFRYSQIARNRNSMDAVELASKTRRISADSAQHGLSFNTASDVFNKGTGAFMYANLAMQAMYQTGKSIQASKGTFLFNLGYVGLQLAALHYVALASDPEAKLKHDNKSMAQKTTSITTFGGAEIRIDPILRLALAPTFMMLDHLTGLEDAQWNGDMLKYFDSIIENDKDVDTEAYKQDTSDTLWELVKANNPFAATSQPLIGAAFATAGVDSGMTRASGELTPVRTQQLSGIDPDGERMDSMGSAWAGNMVATVFGVAGDTLWNMADDAFRAYGHKEGTIKKAVTVGLDRYKEGLARGSTVFTPMIFGNREPVYTATDTNAKLERARREGTEKYIAVNNRDARTGNTTGTQLQGEVLQTPEPGVGPRPNEVVGTKLQLIGQHASELASDLKPFRDEIGNLAKDAENVRNWYFSPQQQRQGFINKNIERRRQLTFQMLAITRERELRVREQVGDPDFTFDQFEPDKYMEPIAPPAQ